MTPDRREAGWFRPGAGATLLAGVMAGACAGDTGEPVATESRAEADTISLEERAGIPAALAFATERDGRGEVYLIEVTGRGERQLVSHPDADDLPGFASPDGSTLPVISVEGGGHGHGGNEHRERLLLVPVEGGEPVPMGGWAGRSRNPSWSPDGRWLIVESDAASFRDLFRVDRRGKDVRRLTNDPEGNFEPHVSPDGEHIAFVSSRDGSAEIYRMRADGENQRRLTAFHRDDWGPRWSPDGATIAFFSNREGLDRIFVMNPDGTGQRRLTETEQGDEASAGAPDRREETFAWSPDGQRVAYVSRTRGDNAVIRLLDLTTGEDLPLTDGHQNDEMPAWSPDGRHLAFVSDRDGEARIYLMRADGSAPTRVTNSSYASWLPRWVGHRNTADERVYGERFGR